MLLIPAILIATIAGSLLAPFYIVPQPIGWLLLGGSLLAGGCCRQRRGLLLVAILPAFFLLANLRYPLQFSADRVVAQLDRQARKLTVTAELQRLRHLRGERTELDLRVIGLREGAAAIPLTTPFLLRLYLDEAVTKLLPGDRLRFKSKLRKPRLFGTPGEFHWPRYLAGQDIAMTGWLKSAEQLSVIGSSEFFPRRSIAAWKERVAAVVTAAVAEQQAPLVRALVLGEARVLPDPLRDKLARAGISHLFAISGLHLGLLGLLGYRLLLGLYRRSATLLNWQPPQRILPLLLLPLLLGYLLLTGDAVSTRRAFCIAVLAAGFYLWRYNVNPIRLLLSLALLFLLFNPLLLWQPAWQLSFAGAAGILFWRPIWQEKTAGLPLLLRAPVRILAITAAATLSTLPLVLLNFHLLTPMSLLANLIAVPIVALLALPVGLCGLLFFQLPLVGPLCFSICGFLLANTVHIIDWLLAVPGFSGQYLFLSRWQYLAVGLLLLPMILLVQPVLNSGRRYFVAACLLSALFFAVLPILTADGVSLYMFSVGQGESLLLTNAAQQALLVDGGGLYGNRFDVGKRLLAPALGELGIHRLSAVLLTHDHPDHRKGLIFVLRNFPVDEFWSGAAFTDLHPQLQAVLREKAIPVRRFPAGWSEINRWGRTPLRLFRGPDRISKNDSSLVLYLPDPLGGLLLTGDLEKKGVGRLLAAGLPGPVSLLKLPHHGSRHSDTEHLIDQLQPQSCLVSAGYRNRYGFPARQLVNYLKQQCIPLYRTDIMGTIRVRKRADRWQVDTWQKGLFR